MRLHLSSALYEQRSSGRMKLSRVIINLCDFVKELNFLKEFHPCGVHVTVARAVVPIDSHEAPKGNKPPLRFCEGIIKLS